MMTRRTRITLFALLVLVLLLLLGWFLYILFSGSPTPVVLEPEPVPVTLPVDTTPSRPTISQKDLETEREVRTVSASVTSLSKTFVSRYGSYSNEANFANLTDVLSLMSASFAKQTQAFIDTTPAPTEYYGVNTSVITVKIDSSVESNQARATMTTQREEAVGSPQNVSVKYQDIVLTFVQEGGEWKVDSAVWQ